ncbi:hypothetical protein ACJIZ3_005845 [Penstemon smallii]|uniref:Uncharacterized protein n=1 Tax=Penstemon smallii TaxID=265156 RepID=A0ABD3S6A7_9LAMI
MGGIEKIFSDYNWGIFLRDCLVDAPVCHKLNEEYVSRLPSGFCKPPMICGFKYSNPMNWVAASNIIASADCTIWNNNPTNPGYAIIVILAKPVCLVT